MLPALIHTLTRDDLEKRYRAGRLRGVFRVSHEDYHAGPGVSSTGIKRLLKSPAHFRQPQEDSATFALGRAIHMALLEPEEFARCYIVWPGGRRQGKVWDDYKASAERDGKEVLSMSEMADVTNMVLRFNRSDVWRGLTAGAEFEIAAYARCPVTGVVRKAKADMVTEKGWIVDLKSTEDASADAFVRSIKSYGYHISSSYYLDVFSDALGVNLNTFLWAAVEKKTPGIRYFPASERMNEIGRIEYRRALEVFKRCEADGDWPGYPDEITPIEFDDFTLRRYFQ